MRGVWIMASEGHRKSGPVRRRSHKTHSSPSQRERARGTRRWPRSDTGRRMAGGHAALEWSSTPSGHAGWPWPSSPLGLCVQPWSRESLESPVHGWARETFSAPRLGPLQACLCATV